jgi:segregation and condensation protein A
MLQYARFRGAGGWTRDAHALGQAFLYRAAPLPPALRRVSVEVAQRAYDADVLGQAIGSLLRMPPPLDLRHMAMPRVSVADRLAHLRSLLSRRSGRFSFEEAVQGADRITVAVTLFALLELYKSGEAAWEQEVPFGPITVHAA